MATELNNLAGRLGSALKQATAELLAARDASGHWTGQLSSSALSTATAVTALALMDRQQRTARAQDHVARGLDWLAHHANADGAWGDTTISLSNLSTTTLCWAAFGAAGADQRYATTVQHAEQWLADKLGVLPSEVRSSPALLASAIIARYGKDRTFSVPILTMCALAGRLGEGRAAWQHVIPLPFELAACPHQLFAALRLPVVSYALPALIAIGQARFHCAPPRNPISRVLRRLVRPRTLRILGQIQPPNGGFLEATPLTSFVTMSLAGAGHADHPVARRGVAFLLRSQRPDGSWPIDTNLATWLTTLSIQALGAGALDGLSTNQLRPWLLHQQYRVEHPYTHAAPGGWAWTDLPGGVPDADDTSSALVALRQLGPADDASRDAVCAGVSWLLNLQNDDGGIPTFCRGWGALPFDRSSADITAHAIRAWLAWREDLPAPLHLRTGRAIRAALLFLRQAQRVDGSWVPLWFGNQHSLNEENPTYGTARVVGALAEVARRPEASPADLDAMTNGVRWLLEAQNPDGSWGGAIQAPASLEETALAVEALAVVLAPESPPCALGRAEPAAALARGVAWLIGRVESGTWTEPSPIGFYFAKLWYFERLYPMIFTVGALRQAAKCGDFSA